MFERASKMKLRFASDRGVLSAEDLWDLSLEELDEIALKLDEKKETHKKSFLDVESTENAATKLQLDIVLYVLKVKQEEVTDRKEAADKKKRYDHLLEILSRKQDAELEEMSIEDIRKEIDELS